MTWDGSQPSAVLHNSNKEKNLGSSAEMKQRTEFGSEEEAKGMTRGRKEAEQQPEDAGAEGKKRRSSRNESRTGRERQGRNGKTQTQ